jgi:hypothetical protein
MRRHSPRPEGRPRVRRVAAASPAGAIRIRVNA